MSGDVHVRFSEGVGVRFPRATRLVVHCRSRKQARYIHCKIVERLRACRLEAHPEKTKIVYCQDEDRKDTAELSSFDFLGYTFRPRRSKNRRGKYFINFSPAISSKAAKSIRDDVRAWGIHRKSDKSLEDLARMLRVKIRGWINYYGRYYKSALYPIFKWLNRRLVRWAQHKYKRYRHQRRATEWLRGVALRNPDLFPHWCLGVTP